VASKPILDSVSARESSLDNEQARNGSNEVIGLQKAGEWMVTADIL
jgi:hypothetical protein